jgi:hypothetical protein
MTRLLLAAAILLAPALASAQDSKTFRTEDGLYSVTVQFAAGSLTVVEPNKTSVYQEVSPREYHFVNPTNGIKYGMRVVDDKTLLAFKPGSDAPPTKLNLFEFESGDVSDEDYEKYADMAQKYLERAQAEPKDVHLWTACGAAAMTRAMGSDAEFRRHALQTSRMLKSIMDDTRNSPCTDAIPQEIWASAR